MNLFKEQGVKDHVAAASQIPVIDFAPYFAGAPGALRAVAAQVRDASENVGFFYALGHGVDQATVDRAFAASRRFHTLPLEQKLDVKLNENNIGYMPINASVQGASTVHRATRPNLNESFFISHDRNPDHPDIRAGLPLRGCNQWPESLPDIRTDMMEYFTALGAMSTGCCRLSQSRWTRPKTSSLRSSPMRVTTTFVSCTIRRKTPTRTISSARHRTPTTAL